MYKLFLFLFLSASMCVATEDDKPMDIVDQMEMESLVESLTNSLSDRTQVEDEADFFEDVLNIESRLNKKVLQQPGAVKAVTTAIQIYEAGIKEKNLPVGVFLMLGPTGVGKTELAKALNADLYKDPLAMLRFDMSHFTSKEDGTRLIGSPPGYMDHAEGGQLTGPLRNNPKRVVLLDEMEKAHPAIHKMFLPVFDEGYIQDADNKRVDCNTAVFIMTSNLCGPEIADLFREGKSAEEILALIEPELMRHLSPELYNRVEPVVFEPLRPETMRDLVNLMTNSLVARVKIQKKVKLIIDDSLKEYLAVKGYHPLLGARPLKKLIEKKVIYPLALSILIDGVHPNLTIIMKYNEKTDSVDVIRK